tara:strand:- start:1286 stop:1969 length:684 start_codon:yes stop_codon:yes gene_type:complete
MYDAKQSANDSKTLLKIGYMSTVNIQQIISRYATGCGQNIIVYQFLDSEPKEMEAKFKKHFRAHHVELEFYDASHHYDYLHWCLNYTKSSPIIGYGKLKCVSEMETKSTGIQCDITSCNDIGTQCVIEHNEVEEKTQVNDNDLGYDVIDSNIEMNSKWCKIDEKRVKCLNCEIVLLKCKFSRHEKSCKGVPLDKCKYCFKHCVSNTAKYKHQYICKLNPMNYMKKVK